MTVGNWQVYIQDFFGCTSFYNFEIDSDPSLELGLLVQTLDSCSLTPTGEILLYAYGGVEDYTYTTGSTYYTSSLFENLIAEAYEVGVYDTKNYVIDSVEILEMDPTIIIDGWIIDSDSPLITITEVSDVSGLQSLSAYTFNIDGGGYQSSPVFSGLTSATIYDFTAKDICGNVSDPPQSIETNP